MIHYRADWVLPISGPPIRDGWIAVDDDRVAAVLDSAPRRLVDPIDLGSVAVLPGLVNAHTHLELSYLRGVIPPAKSFVDWIRGIITTRKKYPDPHAPEIIGAVHASIAEAVGAGTAIVGDISNTLVTSVPLVRSPLAAMVFYELIRFKADDPGALVAQALDALGQIAHSDRVRSSLAAHAPYSVSRSVFDAMRASMSRHLPPPCSVHLSESMEETEFIRTGGGPWRAMLEELGAWDPAWTPPRVTPVEYLDAIGFLGPTTVAVHGVQMTDSDLRKLASRRTTLVTCPRSNIHTGAGAPPIERFYASGVRVAVGTDSLSSVEDLNVFAELAAMRRLAPGIRASTLLASATKNGAEALGFGADYGTIEPGKRARLIAVDVPASCSDVEEYLVNGITPSQVRWLTVKV
jgi:cytosine/adenosine deaminase-related metal-dependent hydrolase